MCLLDYVNGAGGILLSGCPCVCACVIIYYTFVKLISCKPLAGISLTTVGDQNELTKF